MTELARSQTVPNMAGLNGRGSPDSLLSDTPADTPDTPGASREERQGWVSVDPDSGQLTATTAWHDMLGRSYPVCLYIKLYWLEFIDLFYNNNKSIC